MFDKIENVREPLKKTDPCGVDPALHELTLDRMSCRRLTKFIRYHKADHSGLFVDVLVPGEGWCNLSRQLMLSKRLSDELRPKQMLSIAVQVASDIDEGRHASVRVYLHGV